MSNGSDPNAITKALDAAIDVFNQEGYGVPKREDEINSDANWKTQLTKACRCLAAVEQIAEQGFYTATIELCFGATERSVEAFALAVVCNTVSSFNLEDWNQFLRNLCSSVNSSGERMISVSNSSNRWKSSSIVNTVFTPSSIAT